MYYAHSTSSRDKNDWHRLPDHLKSVASLAEAFGSRLGIGRASALAGLLHDLGKYSPVFQARLEGAAIQVDHSTAGASMVRMLGAKGEDAMIAELIAYAIAGHHAGLPDRIGAAGSLDERLANFDRSTLDVAWSVEITPDATALRPAFAFSNKAAVPFQLSFLGRMIFSCLVDADFKDTEAFYNAVEGRIADRTWPALQDILPDLIERLDGHMSRLGQDGHPVNRLRREILAHVQARATETVGLFTLTVPTGGGKTLASLAFALHHAQQHGHERIIYAIPFTSIIDQTAAIFRGVLGDDYLLEHHSAIEDQSFTGRQGRDKLRLAMEDWAAPIVVTTNVQLFESLFAARPSRARKLHNIANSVIVLDEAQTIPKPLLAPCVRAIDELARNYGCSIVLCTATQPALDQRRFSAGDPMGLPLEGRELAPDPPALAVALRRTTVVRVGEMANAALIEALERHAQGLIIVNSRKHALDLFTEAKTAGLDGLVHLTTRHYAAHRQHILSSVRQLLKEGRTCRVIATSLVEAGVDVDFPRVWRAEAGLDQIAQAAGRCNREGRRSAEESIVTIFGASDYPPPPEIKGLSGDLARMADKFDDLLSPAAIEEFFGEVYWRMGDALDRERILDEFQMGRSKQGMTNFAYRTVAEKFRMIESGMVPVIVARDAPAAEAVERLKIEAIPSGAIARDLQRYMVQVPPKARNLLIANRHVRFIAPDLRRDQFAVLATPSLYRDDTGLIWEDANYLGLEQSMI